MYLLVSIRRFSFLFGRSACVLLHAVRVPVGDGIERATTTFSKAPYITGGGAHRTPPPGTRSPVYCVYIALHCCRIPQYRTHILAIIRRVNKRGPVFRWVFVAPRKPVREP